VVRFTARADQTATDEQVGGVTARAQKGPAMLLQDTVAVVYGADEEAS
jgi:hypothetical protein